METKIKKFIVKGLLCCGAVALLSPFSSCKEDIDELNLYTFTGETIEDYLTNRSERFSSFNYILSRIGYDKILSAYGTYTCFAPDNDAIAHYLDSLYNDTVNVNIPHNGLTAPGIEGLGPENPKADSLCEDIALFHLLGTKIMGVNMGNGMTIKTMLGRDINTSIDPGSGEILISRHSAITSMDNELENGVLHEISQVISRSNMLVAGELENRPDLFTIFTQALKLTGLVDSLSAISTTDVGRVDNKRNFYTPEKCELGYTIFPETDQALAAKGINNLDDLKAYANKVYGNCADKETGWYDYARNHNIKISTETDYMNPWNTLNMFVRYHILDYKIPYDKLVTSNQVSKVMLVEYYETMLPYTMLKITKNSNKLYINRWISNNSLTDMVAELGSAGMHTVLFDGIDLKGSTAQIASLNGYIHPVNDILVYDSKVPQGALNERIRIDDTAIFGEMMSNSLRWVSYSQVKALNGGKQGSDGRHANCDYIRFPPKFFKNLAIYNGEDTRFYYFPGRGSSWSNYQEDEFNCMGNYDFAFRLPPVPDGTYELRVGYTAEDPQRGMLQFYIGSSSDLSTMKALDIPLDMRHIPANNSNLTPDAVTGWCDWSRLDDKGIESDANMRNLGYMRGPLYYTVGVNSGNYARNNPKDLRRIVARQEFKQGDYWVRCKSVIENPQGEFHLDYIEFCPENVYNNTRYVEDMY